MIQLLTIALHLLKSINEVVLGSDVEVDAVRKAKNEYYTYTLYTRM